jgi:hypothetical protein
MSDSDSLRTACESGDTLVVVTLIEKGADVNEQKRDEIGRTPLHDACRSGHTATAAALIERGADVNKKNRYGRAPLYAACYFRHSTTAILLLENGAVGVNDRDKGRIAPSFWAFRHCTADVALLMIRQGAVLTATDLWRFRDQPTVTDEQACTVEAAYKREDNWRRRAHYAMFLSSIRDLVEHEPAPSAPAALGEGGGIGRRTRAAAQARLICVVDKVLCRTNTQRLIGSFL